MAGVTFEYKKTPAVFIFVKLVNVLTNSVDKLCQIFYNYNV